MLGTRSSLRLTVAAFLTFFKTTHGWMATGTGPLLPRACAVVDRFAEAALRRQTAGVIEREMEESPRRMVGSETNAATGAGAAEANRCGDHALFASCRAASMCETGSLRGNQATATMNLIPMPQSVVTQVRGDDAEDARILSALFQRVYFSLDLPCLPRIQSKRRE